MTWLVGIVVMPESSQTRKIAPMRNARCRSATEARGSTVRPMPLATMWRIVSSEEPSKVRCMPLPGEEKRAISGHTSSTWSRKARIEVSGSRTG